MAILSFLGCVNIAVRIVTEKYPDAQLYEVNGVSSTGMTTDPLKIDQLRVVFHNSNNSTVIIKSTGWGEFGEPELIPHIWVGDVIIQWPVKMDLTEANQLKEAAGYKTPYNAVTLRNPLGAVKSNPCYIFNSDHKGTYIFVDTITKEVYTGVGLLK